MSRENDGSTRRPNKSKSMLHDCITGEYINVSVLAKQLNEKNSACMQVKSPDFFAIVSVAIKPVTFI